MYKIKITKSIWNLEEQEVKYLLSEKTVMRCSYDKEFEKECDSKNLQFIDYFYEIELPFTPHMGLSIIQESWSCGPIISVCWDDRYKIFHCRVEDEYPHQALDTYIDSEFLNERCIRQGWCIE